MTREEMAWLALHRRVNRDKTHLKHIGYAWMQNTINDDTKAYRRIQRLREHRKQARKTLRGSTDDYSGIEFVVQYSKQPIIGECHKEWLLDRVRKAIQYNLERIR